MSEIGYLLNRMMKGIQKARDSFEEKKKLDRNSRRSLTSIATFPVERGNCSMGSINFQSVALTSTLKE